MPGPLGRLSVQIALGPVLVIALLSTAMLWRMEGHLQAQAEARFADRVKIASAQLDERIRSDVQLRVVGATVLAGQASFVTALESNDAATAVQIAGAFMARTTLAQAGASGIRIYGPAGQLLLRAEAPQNMAQRTIPPEVLTAVRTTKPVGAVRLDETLGLAVSGIAPVQTADGRTIAAVEAITSLDRSFARSAAGLLETEVAVLAAGKVAATSDGGAIDPAIVTDEVRRRAQQAPVHLGMRNEEYLSSFVTYRDPSGSVIGDVYVGIDDEKIHATVEETRGAILRTMVAGVLGASVVAWLFGWLATRPLRPLLAAAGRLQQNDLESPVAVSGSTELRQLAEAMEDMRLAIRQSRDALQSANRDLAMRISTSDASLSEVTQDLDVMQRVVSHLAGESAGGLPGVAEALLDLNWVDGTFIALATESGALSIAASAGLPPGASNAVLATVEPRLLTVPQAELVVHDSELDPADSRLAAWLVRGLVIAPMLTPDGIAGIVCVTSQQPLVLSPQRRELLRSIAHEVTAALERSELADEVEENRRVAEAVLREMADGVIVVDHENLGQICNPAAARLLGLSRAQIVGRPADEWMPVTGSTLDHLRRRIVDGAAGARTPLVVETGGAQLAITAGPFPDPDPARIGVILLIRDLSAEAEAERVKRDFVSMVGHELRTPLTLIRTTIDLLHSHDAGELNPTQARIVEVLLHNSDRLMSLISDLLDMSALDSGRMQITPASIDLVDVVQRAARNAHAAAEDRKHRLRVTAPETATVWADAARVEQVLSNLLSNAVKYTPPGGEIEVRVTPGDPFISVAVQDSGIGIPPEEQGGLFEKFYRTSSGRKTTGGTGLGLAIARSIVDLHGGTIRCDSDGLHGTTFTFTLPRRPL